MLKEIQDNVQNESQELKQYKRQVKSTIEQLIVNQRLDEARKIITEYKTIIPKDLEIILLESKISLLN